MRVMYLINVINISKSYEGKDILNNISFGIEDGDKVGVIGNNGAGKSTLFKIIAGLEECDEGKIENSYKNLIGYLPQEFMITDKEKSVEDYIKEYVGILEIEKRMKDYEDNLGDEKILEKYCKIQEEYIMLDGYNFDYKLDEVLNGLGFNEEIRKKKIKELSGGQKSKVLLGGVLIKGADLLLLDEPTNNLDLKSIIWLEKYLNNTNTPCMIISHDRRFLDKTTNKTFEIDFFDKTLKEYPASYSEYYKFKKKEQERKKAEYEQQQEKIKEIRSSLKEKKDWAQKGRKQGVKDNDKYTRGYERDRSSGLASQAKSIEKKIEQMDKLERPKEKEKLKFDIDFSTIKGSTNIIANNLICGYENGFITNELSLDCKFGERLVIIGDNGAGKSTFIKTLLGEEKPLAGEDNIGTRIKIGYISQDTQKNADITVEEYMNENCKAEKAEIFTTLHKFNFDYEERDKKYCKLSPGERTRLKLATFAINDINTLVLDEPTNHLDIEALEALEEVLESFKGTVIAITHDRYFIEKLEPDKVIELKDGKFRNVQVENLKKRKAKETEEYTK